MKAVRNILLLILCIFIFPFITAADSSTPEGFEKYFNNISTKLDLTGQQKTEVMPIFLSDFNETMSVFKKYGFDPSKGEKPGIFKLEKMKDGLQQSEKEIDKKLSVILSSQQMDKLNQIRAEEKKQMEEELEAHKK